MLIPGSSFFALIRRTKRHATLKRKAASAIYVSAARSHPIKNAFRSSYSIVMGLFKNSFKLAERTVFSRSIAMVTGPTPPGTGVT